MIEKTTKQRILEYFFTNPTTKTYFRQLSRETKLSMPTIIQKTNELRNEGLIKIRKEIALTILEANTENPSFTRLKRINNIAKLYETGLVDYLNEKTRNAQAIICFGSYSKGEDIERSDIDIAIISHRKPEISLDKFEKLLKRKISLHYVDLSRVSEELKANLCNGVVMEGAI